MHLSLLEIDKATNIPNHAKTDNYNYNNSLPKKYSLGYIEEEGCFAQFDWIKRQTDRFKPVRRQKTGKGIEDVVF
jgi:hypothetical protein